MSTMLKVALIGGIAFIILGVATNFAPTMLTGFESTRNAVTVGTDVENLETPAASGSANHTTSTLVYAPYAGLTTSVTAVTSNVSGDVLSCALVNGTSINITGYPDTTQTRTVTVTYNYGSVARYTGLNTVIQFGPTMIILGFVIAVGVVGFMGLKLWRR